MCRPRLRHSTTAIQGSALVSSTDGSGSPRESAIPAGGWSREAGPALLPWHDRGSWTFAARASATTATALRPMRSIRQVSCRTSSQNRVRPAMPTFAPSDDPKSFMHFPAFTTSTLCTCTQKQLADTALFLHLCRHSLATSSQQSYLALLLRINKFHHSTQPTYRDRTTIVRVEKVQDQLDLHTNPAALCSR